MNLSVRGWVENMRYDLIYDELFKEYCKYDRKVRLFSALL